MSDDVHDSKSGESCNHDLTTIYAAYKSPLSQWLIAKTQADFIDAEEAAHDFLTEKLCPESKLQEYIAKYRESKSKTPGLRFRFYLRKSALNFYIDKVRKKKRISDGLEELLKERDLGDEILYETPTAREDFDRVSAISIFNKAYNDARDHCRKRGREDDLWYIIEKKYFEPLRDGGPEPNPSELANGLRDVSVAQIRNLMITAKRCVLRALAQALVVWEGLDGMESDRERKAAFREAWGMLRKRLQESQGDMNSSRQITGESGYFVGDESSMGTTSDISMPEVWMENPTAELWELHLESSVNDIFAIWRDWAPQATGLDRNPPKDVKRKKLMDLLFPPLGAGTVSLSVLKMLRDAAKSVGWDIHRQEERAKLGQDKELQEELKSHRKIMEAIYLVPIAAARIHHDAKLSTDDDAKFVKRFKKLLRAEWIDLSSKALIQEWMRRFGPDSATGE